MAMAPGDEWSDLLARTQAGDPAAESELVATLYQDLRAIAGRRMRRERPGHTSQPTALVNEVPGVSRKTVERDWGFARAWLRERLKPSEIP